FIANGIVRQADADARQSLGVAFLGGMDSREIFRDAGLGWDESGSRLTEALAGYLRENVSCGGLEARYFTPAGQVRLLDITLSPMQGPAGDILGSACVINNHTEIAEVRREQALHGEISAEMALALRNSLATISEYARHL